uniref:Uncharacterized protein n=1 Tax=Piliocolobus tephrosceles TaxID=591936 RepID=A0A8C9GUN3_9PRIM
MEDTTRTNESVWITISSTNLTSPVVEFWGCNVPSLSPGINHRGSFKWDLSLCLLLVWLACFLCIWKNIRSTQKVVYFTATFQFAMLLMQLVRELTLPSMGAGINFYLCADLTCLEGPQVWIDATTRIFFYAICLGAMTSLRSYNKYRCNSYTDCMLLGCLNSGTSLCAWLRNFFLSGLHVRPCLVFIAYPKAVTMMPLRRFRYPSPTFFFFFLLYFSCLDWMTSLLKSKGRSRPWLMFTILPKEGLPSENLHLATEVGMYVFDYYVASGVCLLGAAFFDYIVIVWIYGIDNVYDSIENTIGYRAGPWMKYSWAMVTPFLCVGCFSFSIVKYIPLIYNETYVCPKWAIGLGWSLALSSRMWVPLVIVIRLCQAEGLFLMRQGRSVPYSPHPRQHLLLSYFFDYGHSNRGKVISQCGFDLCFPDH